MNCFSCNRSAFVTCDECAPEPRAYCVDCDNIVHQGIWVYHIRVKVLNCEICGDHSAVVSCSTCPAIEGEGRVAFCERCFNVVHGLHSDDVSPKPEVAFHQVMSLQLPFAVAGNLACYLRQRRGAGSGSVKRPCDDGDDDEPLRDKRHKPSTPAPSATPDVVLIESDEEDGPANDGDGDAPGFEFLPTTDESDTDGNDIDGNDTDGHDSDGHEPIVPLPLPTVLPSARSTRVLRTLSDEAEYARYSTLRLSKPIVHPKATMFARMEEEIFFEHAPVTPESKDVTEAARRHHARIKKLIVLGMHQGTSAAEAKHALLMAQRLMAEHGLSEADLDASVEAGAVANDGISTTGGRARKVHILRRDNTPIAQRISGTWTSNLASQCAKTFNVKFYRLREDFSMVFYGIPNRVDEAALAFEMAFNRVVSLSRQFHGKQDVSFMTGIVDGMTVATEAEERTVYAELSQAGRAKRDASVKAALVVADGVAKLMNLKLRSSRRSAARIDRSKRASGKAAASHMKLAQKLLD